MPVLRYKHLYSVYHTNCCSYIVFPQRDNRVCTSSWQRSPMTSADWWTSACWCWTPMNWTSYPISSVLWLGWRWSVSVTITLTHCHRHSTNSSHYRVFTWPTTAFRCSQRPSPTSSHSSSSTCPTTNSTHCLKTSPNSSTSIHWSSSWTTSSHCQTLYVVWPHYGVCGLVITRLVNFPSGLVSYTTWTGGPLGDTCCPLWWMGTLWRTRRCLCVDRVWPLSHSSLETEWEVVTQVKTIVVVLLNQDQVVIHLLLTRLYSLGSKLELGITRLGASDIL